MKSQKATSRSEFLFNKNILNSKRSQHETMGFVLIVVVVSIIGLVFLSLSIGRGDNNKSTSLEISNLLEASMQYTTDCSVSFIPQYKSGQDLVKSCYRNEKCLNEKMACDVLKETMKEIIDSSLDICEDCVNKGYKFEVYYRPLDSKVQNDEILVLENGVFSNCSSKFGGKHSIPVSSINAGIINIELDVCK